MIKCSFNFLVIPFSRIRALSRNLTSFPPPSLPLPSFFPFLPLSLINSFIYIAHKFQAHAYHWILNMYFLSAETFVISKLIKCSYFSFMYSYLSIPIPYPEPSHRFYSVIFLHRNHVVFPKGSVVFNWSLFFPLLEIMELTGMQLP